MNPRMLTICALVTMCCSSQSQEDETEEFSPVLAKHLRGISERNLGYIEATVDDHVTLILPDGSMVESKQEFVEFHRQWFKDPTWKMEQVVLETNEGRDMSYCLLNYRIIRVGENAGPETFLLLVFRKQATGWKLVHDQNTRVAR